MASSRLVSKSVTMAIVLTSMDAFPIARSPNVVMGFSGLVSRRVMTEIATMTMTAATCVVPRVVAMESFRVPRNVMTGMPLMAMPA